jgi:CheY-like chemotaxis protein
MDTEKKSIDILLVEDNPGDVRLIIEAFKDTEIPHNLVVAPDGMEAMQMINKEGKYSNTSRPKLIILDLNLPKKSGWEVLKEIKHDDSLKKIPIVILTTSSAEKDIEETYDNHVNAYLTKPVDLNQFINVAKSIQDFWLNNVKLP